MPHALENRSSALSCLLWTLARVLGGPARKTYLTTYLLELALSTTLSTQGTSVCMIVRNPNRSVFAVRFTPALDRQPSSTQGYLGPVSSRTRLSSDPHACNPLGTSRRIHRLDLSLLSNGTACALLSVGRQRSVHSNEWLWCVLRLSCPCSEGRLGQPAASVA